MNTVYQWRGESIDNIEQWAKDRGEQMVDVTLHKKEVTLGGAELDLYEEESMPESFFNTMCFREGWHPIKNVSRDPAASVHTQERP
jgi:hypothetical protein